MNKQETFEKQAVLDTHKLFKVIASCRNLDHLKGARRYFRLWQKKYRNLITTKFEEDTYFNEMNKNGILQLNGLSLRFGNP